MMHSKKILPLVLLFSACASPEKGGPDPFPSDELPKSPKSAALDPAYVVSEQAKKADTTEYRQALTRSTGFFFSMRLMLLTDPYLKTLQADRKTEALAQKLQSDSQGKTCFRYEYDTFDKEAGKPENWEATWATGTNDPKPLQTMIDEESIRHIEKTRSLLIRGYFCSESPLDVLPGFKVSVTRKWEKKPEAIVFEWTEWKPGVSQAPTRVHW